MVKEGEREPDLIGSDIRISSESSTHGPRFNRERMIPEWSNRVSSKSIPVNHLGHLLGQIRHLKLLIFVLVSTRAYCSSIHA